MVYFNVTKRFLQECASNLAPIYFGVSLNSVQARDFANQTPREVSSFDDVLRALDAYVSKLISDSKVRGGLL